VAAPDLRVLTADGDRLEQVLAVADAARAADGVEPFNEQTRLDLASGRRLAHAGYVDDVAVAAAVTGGGELDLVVRPSARGPGYGSAMLTVLLPDLEPDVAAWSHGDHPGARALAAAYGFDRVRELLHLRLPALPQGGERSDEEGGQAADGIRIVAFDPSTDAAAWLALNARAFSSHPEQGRMSAADLAEREAERWFDPEDFLVAKDESGRMLGFHWMKLEPGSDEGEVYVLGVSPAAAGRGLGGRMLTAGLRHMRSRGRATASLYVEGDNARALALYRRAGFVDDGIDVQYRQRRHRRRPGVLAPVT
jgi:mycothiol synthase